MTQIHFHGPDSTPEYFDGLCLVCLMVARGAELDATEEEWAPLARDGNDQVQKWYAWEGRGVLIRDAVVNGVSDVLPQAGLVPLCWDHLAGLTLPKPARRLANGGRGPLPPGLHRGRG